MLCDSKINKTPLSTTELKFHTSCSRWVAMFGITWLLYLHKLYGKIFALRNVHLNDQKSLEKPDWEKYRQRSEVQSTCQTLTKYITQMNVWCGMYESMVTYELFSHSLAFASWLSGCYPPDSKQILWLLYYIPIGRNNRGAGLDKTDKR